ncbi:hypothetical protein [Krasilnikovia sp. MM14-A1004]|uniref:hypothetical protein n=1 Tax=Krasilnikovia sp. MM14-A1004 TaxID=3373541 RepID=UPI00399D0E91
MTRSRAVRTLLGTVAGLAVAMGMATPAYADGPTGNPGRTYETFRGKVALHVSYATQWLDSGKAWYFGLAKLSFQSNGNLVISDRSTGRTSWSTNTANSGATRMKFQTDGNLVLYKANGVAVWSSKTNNKCTGLRSYPLLALQEDSNFVIYCGKNKPLIEDLSGDQLTPMWATGT